MEHRWQHRRLDFRPPRSTAPVWAELYRFGEATGPAPLVLYVRGGPKRSLYLEDRASHYEHVTAVFEEMVAKHGWPRIDLVICASPMSTLMEDSGKPGGVEWWEAHLDERLLPELGADPSAMATIGHSAGGPVALHLGVFAQARARGFVKTSEETQAFYKALRSNTNDGWQGFEYRIYCNAHDPIAEQPADYRGFVPSPIRPVEMERREGEHDVNFYIANQDLHRAFHFLIGAVL